MASSGPSKTDVDAPRARVILQQCLHARLMVQPQTEEIPAEYVEIQRGIIAYICFLKGANEDIIDKMVKSVLGIRLSAPESGKLVSVRDIPGDTLIVPQATLGGRPKGKLMQYHNNIDKDTGRELYTLFCEKCKNTYLEDTKCKEADKTVKCGTYGNTQVLSVETNGPYTHMIEF